MRARPSLPRAQAARRCAVLLAVLHLALVGGATAAPKETRAAVPTAAAPVFSEVPHFSPGPQTLTLGLAPGSAGTLYYTVSALASYPEKGSITGTLTKNEIPAALHGYTMANRSTPTFPNDMRPEANEPREVPQNAYGAPISLTTTAVVRARVFEPGKAPSPIVTRTYFIGERLSAIPVVSIAAEGRDLWDPTPLWHPGSPLFDPDDFVGEESEAQWDHGGEGEDRPSLPGGIYVLGSQAFGNGTLTSRYPHFLAAPKANFANHRKYIPAHLEFFNADRSLRAAADFEMRISGNFSSGLPKRSLMVKARSPGGRKALADAFRGVPGHEYRTVFLRTGGDPSRVRNEMLYRLDQQAREQLASPLDMQSYEPAVVFINGQYWGVHNITEEKGDEFVEQHHGYEDDEIQMVDRSQIAHIPRKPGDAASVLPDYKALRDRLNRVGADAAYANAEGASGFAHWFTRNVDVRDFVDHFIFETYFSKSDPSNIRVWKPLVGGKWRFISHDYDDIDARGSSAARNFLATSRRADSRFEDGAMNSIWLSALNSREIRNQFINRACDYMNTVFAPANIQGILGAQADFVESSTKPPASGTVAGAIFDEMRREVPRWYYLYGGADATRYEWGRKVRDLHEFADRRPRYFRQFMMDEWRLPGSGAAGSAIGSGAVAVTVDVSPAQSGVAMVSSVRPSSYPWKGLYLASVPGDAERTVPVPLRAVPRSGFRFKQWMDGSAVLSTDPETELVLTGPRTLVAQFEPGADPLTSDLAITEVRSGTPGATEPGDKYDELIRIKNTGVRTLYLGGLRFTSGIEYTFPRGARLSAGETAVLAPSLEILEKRHAEAATSAAFVDTYLGRLKDKGETLRVENQASVPVLTTTFPLAAAR